MIPASVLNDWILQAQAEYDRACGFLIGMRDNAAADPVAAGAREMALPHLQKVCDIYLSRVEQLTDIARGVEAEEREAQRRLAHYTEQARLAAEIDRQRTFGGRPYDVPRCAHGCCPDAVCEFVGDCASHQAAS